MKPLLAFVVFWCDASEWGIVAFEKENNRVFGFINRDVWYLGRAANVATFKELYD